MIKWFYDINSYNLKDAGFWGFGEIFYRGRTNHLRIAKFH